MLREQLKVTYKDHGVPPISACMNYVVGWTEWQPGLKETEITSKRVTDKYRRTVQFLVANSSSAVSHNFVDCAKTVAARMLRVPEIRDCLTDLDDYHSIAGEAQ